MIYLDNASTTPVWESAIKAAEEVYRTSFFNPSSTYRDAIPVKMMIRTARTIVAKRLGCPPEELYFTSGATECNNWAITCGAKNGKGNIVISGGEHACVYECAKNLKTNKGYDVRISGILPDGTVDAEDLIGLIDENTRLVSVIHASNETGAVNDIAALSKRIKAKNPNVIFHSDGVQAYLKISNDVRELGVDLYSVSGHKVGAPKGVGAMYVSSKTRLQPFIFGGGQEYGMRSGTENVAGIAAFGVATEEYLSRFDREKILSLRKRFIDEVSKTDGVTVLGNGAETNATILALSIAGTRAEIIQSMCSDENVLIGRGSACASRHSGNRVLEAMGLKKKDIDGAIRISFSPLTTEEEVVTAAKVIARNSIKLRGNNVG